MGDLGFITYENGVYTEKNNGVGNNTSFEEHNKTTKDENDGSSKTISTKNPPKIKVKRISSTNDRVVLKIINKSSDSITIGKKVDLLNIMDSVIGMEVIGDARTTKKTTIAPGGSAKITYLKIRLEDSVCYTTPKTKVGIPVKQKGKTFFYWYDYLSASGSYVGN